MTCAYCEERISDYLDGALGADEQVSIDLHLQSCGACSELLAGMRAVVAWGRSFPIHQAPAWLPARILANTPVIARESWLDTLTFVGRWIMEPRTAMAVFTATLVLGWLGSIAGVSPNWAAIVRDPAAIYYRAEGLMKRTYYRSPLLTQIQSRIEQLREIS